MNRLLELRKANNLTQQQIEIKIGIDQSRYSKIERGQSYFTLEECKRLAVLLGTSMDYLNGLTDEKSPYPRIFK